MGGILGAVVFVFSDDISCLVKKDSGGHRDWEGGEGESGMTYELLLLLLILLVMLLGY